MGAADQARKYACSEQPPPNGWLTYPATLQCLAVSELCNWLRSGAADTCLHAKVWLLY